jgi:PPOX class probable FMN-dependent enzyme
MAEGSMSDMAPHAAIIDSLDALEQLYAKPAEASLVKEIDHVNAEYRALIEASPFCVLATAGPEGLDCSPRGDEPGFVRVHDAKTLMIPDRRGNNRIDSLRNIVRDPRVALLFLVPGVAETLRVNGRASISVAPALLDSFAVNGKRPQCVMVVTVERIYFQCARAIYRSKLWDPTRHVDRKTLPSTGGMLAATTGGRFDGESYDRELPARQQATLY